MNVLMPQLGETVSEGKVIRWFKAVGDAVAAGENLCEIETDKVTVEVPAIAPGVLSAINAEVGTVAPVGAVIAVLGEPAGAGRSKPEPATLAPVSKAPVAIATSVASNTDLPVAPGASRKLDPFREVQTPLVNFGPARLPGGVVVSPLARRLAVNSGVDLARIAGSGPHGRINAKDVAKAVDARPSPPSLDRAETFEEMIGEVHRGRPHTILPIDGMRRTIARRLVVAKATIPHFYLSADVAVDSLSRIRDEINAGAPKTADGSPTYRLAHP